MCERREQLLEYLYDEASPAIRQDVERHLEGCEDCRDEIRAFRNVREDLLAWGVPNPPSVWTAFAPAAVVPWHKQVPAWAMAAAASLMLVVGSAGGFLAHSVVEGNSPEGNQTVNVPAIPAEVTQASLLDSKAILSLIREELSIAARDQAGKVVPVSNKSARPAQLDPKAEAQLIARVNDLVSASHEQQNLRVYNYLVKVGQEDDLRRRDNDIKLGNRLMVLQNQIETLSAQVTQLMAAQGKGQQ